MDIKLLEIKYKKIKKWCEDNSLFYLRANITIPEEVISEAQRIYSLKLFTPHRVSHGKGWSSATLHGEDWNITHYDPDKKDLYKKTQILEMSLIKN